MKLNETEQFILLNKPFNGSWTYQDGNIAHEIIDFFLTDSGEYYVYNIPYGRTCNGRVPDYIVLTSEGTNVVKIEYIIKPSEAVHGLGYSTRKKDDNKDGEKDNYSPTNNNEENRKKIEHIIKEKNIRYGGKLLSKLYDSKTDVGLLVSYKAEWIKKPKEPLVFDFRESGYIFQHAYGYISNEWNIKYVNNKYFGKDKLSKRQKDIIETSEKKSKAYHALKKKIEELDQKGELVELPLSPIDVHTKKFSGLTFSKTTFLDFILKTNSEECYTNLLYNLFVSDKNLFCRFVQELLNQEGKEHTIRSFNSSTLKYITREKSVSRGRMDICAEFEINGMIHRIVLENKVDSGLNGKGGAENQTQLTQYYNWATENGATPHCFILVPGYHENFLLDEIKTYDKDMMDNYTIIKYRDIFDFIKAHSSDIKSNKNYRKFYADIFELFGRLSLDRLSLFEYLVIQAILNA